MKAAIYRGEKDIRVEDIKDPELQDSTDAIIRVTHTAVCGSDLWYYRGYEQPKKGSQVGHEPMGVVEEVGEDVTAVQEGDRVISPFSMSCGKCEFCRKGLHTACINGHFHSPIGNVGGAQAEKLRIPEANGTLMKVPERYADNEKILKRLLPLTDVLPTGHHAAKCANVSAGDTSVVIGDGAVGLCAVLASKRLGAENIIAVGHHEDRLDVAKKFGATHTVSSRGEKAVEEVKELTNGGGNHLLECVGTESALENVAKMARPGGKVGYVGVPHVESADFVGQLFYKNVSFEGGPAPVRSYAEDLMEDVVQGILDPSPILTKTVSLENIAEGYKAMDKREAIKVMVDVQD